MAFRFYQPDDEEQANSPVAGMLGQFGAFASRPMTNETLQAVSEPQPIVPKTPQRGGILGFLARPGVADALMGLGTGMMAGAQPDQYGRTSWARAIGGGAAGAAEGLQTYQDRIAKQQADALNAKIKQAELDKLNRPGGESETDYRFRVNYYADAIQAEDPTIDRQTAMRLAVAKADEVSYQQRADLAGLRYGYDRQLAELSDRMRREAEGRAPDVEARKAAATTEAKAGAEQKAEKQQQATSAQDAILQLNDLKTSLQGLPSPAALKVEGAKAFFGFGDEELQSRLGTIKAISGKMLAYVERLPGAATDKDRIDFKSSAGVLDDDNATAAARIAAANQAIASFQRLIDKYGAPKQQQSGASSARSEADILKQYGVSP